MEALQIPTIWDTCNGNVALQRFPTKKGIIDSFKVHGVTKAQVRAKSELVWANTTFGVNTPEYFSNFGTIPVDDATLDTERNKMQMKHVIMRKKSGRA